MMAWLRSRGHKTLYVGLYSYKHHLDKKNGDTKKILTEINGVIYKVNKERVPTIWGNANG